MEAVERFSLLNVGGFVARLEFEYYDTKSNTWIHTKGTGNITIGQCKAADPGACGVPNGACVRLFAFVVWGADAIAPNMFIYKRGSKQTAQYSISGTTLNNHLNFGGITPGTDSLALENSSSSEPVLHEPNELTEEEWTNLVDALDDTPRSYNGTCAFLGWSVVLVPNSSDIAKSSAQVKVSAFSHEIANCQLDENHPQQIFNQSISSIGIVGEIGIDFINRSICIKGKISYEIGCKDFNYTLLQF